MQGDWLLAGESANYIQRGKLDEACSRFGIAYQTAADAVYVCKAIESSVRNEHLEFGHHKIVAGREDAPALLAWPDRALQAAGLPWPWRSRAPTVSPLVRKSDTAPPY